MKSAEIAHCFRLEQCSQLIPRAVQVYVGDQAGILQHIFGRNLSLCNRRGAIKMASTGEQINRLTGATPTYKVRRFQNDIGAGDCSEPFGGPENTERVGREKSDLAASSSFRAGAWDALGMSYVHIWRSGLLGEPPDMVTIVWNATALTRHHRHFPGIEATILHHRHDPDRTPEHV
jgi:hypothetical protein